MNTKKISITIIITVIIAISVTGSYFVIASDEILSQIILDTDKTIIEQNIQYPSGTPLITSKIIIIPAGAETGMHIHEYPMFAYVMEGQIIVDYGEEYGIKKYVKGDSFVEAVNYSHNGKNNGEIPVKILVVIMQQKG